ncbi:MAG: CPBP family intramembrane glutamic endopeptidase [Candidatus Nanopelagicales bacterium]
MRRLASPLRVRLGLAATLVGLAVWNLLVRPELASTYHVEGSLLVAVVVVVIGLWGGLDADGFGLSPKQLPAGFRYGGIAVAVVTAVVLLGLALPATRASFHATRAEVDGGQLLLELLITIPLGTVVIEELAFRGTLLGLLCRLMTPTRAVLVCSLFFGLWHIDGVVRNTAGSGLHVLAAALGTFLVTAGAGVGFCWLRLRSGSLLAPVLAHLAINTIALALAWIVVH